MWYSWLNKMYQISRPTADANLVKGATKWEEFLNTKEKTWITELKERRKLPAEGTARNVRLSIANMPNNSRELTRAVN
jgi:hypothetical protein